MFYNLYAFYVFSGSDPIQEALKDYDLKRKNNIVPPDIFMGLRFSDHDSQSGIAANNISDDPVSYCHNFLIYLKKKIFMLMIIKF